LVIIGIGVSNSYWANSAAVLPMPENMIFSGGMLAARARSNSPAETTSAPAKDAIGVLSVESSFRQSYGGTAPENVRGQAKRWLKALVKENDHVRHAAAASV
jgi:hypothetical protein